MHNGAVEDSCAGYLNPYSFRNKGPSNKKRYECYEP